MIPQKTTEAAFSFGVGASHEGGNWFASGEVCFSHSEADDDYSVLYFRKLCSMALKGQPSPFLGCFADAVLNFAAIPSIVFAAGKCLVLAEAVDEEERSIFGSRDNFVFRLEAAKKAIETYEKQLIRVREQVDLWSMIAKRLKIIKEVRIKIASLIWESREDVFVPGEANPQEQSFFRPVEDTFLHEAPKMLLQGDFFFSIPQGGEEQEEENVIVKDAQRSTNSCPKEEDPKYLALVPPILSNEQILLLQQWYKV